LPLACPLVAGYRVETHLSMTGMLTDRHANTVSVQPSLSSRNDDIAHVEEVIYPKSDSIWLIMQFSLNHRGFQT
jgi:hypothetical protein